jgi:hypothetical protein
MSFVLFYSNYCENSKSLLQILSKTKVKENIHYLCIDNRIKKNDGNIYLILENKLEIMLPETIKKVPALFILSNGNQTIFGKDNIINHLKPQEIEVNQIATNFNGEPLTFSFNNNGFGVVSDNFSYLDQSPDSLTAKGDGGLRQIYHYATLDYTDKINTPPDNYTPDKIGQTTIEKLQQTRNNIK